MKKFLLMCLLYVGTFLFCQENDKKLSFEPSQDSVKKMVQHHFEIMKSNDCVMILKINELLINQDLNDYDNYKFQSVEWLELWLKNECTNGDYEIYKSEVENKYLKEWII